MSQSDEWDRILIHAGALPPQPPRPAPPPPEERARRLRARAEAHAAHGPQTWQRGLYTLTITEGPRVAENGDVAFLELWVTVARDGELLPIDGYLRIVNPPLALGGPMRIEEVPNTFPPGEGRTRIAWPPLPQPPDPPAALRQMVEDALARQLPELRR